MKPENMFLGTAAKKDGKISIIPIPYEGTCSAQRGTVEGPDAIIKASHNLELYDYELDGLSIRLSLNPRLKR